MSASLLDELKNLSDSTSESQLDALLRYYSQHGIELYPAQEEALLGIFDQKHIILNTPTGSGKSLVATAMHFAAMANGQASVYTSPIKALVHEKFLALCRDFGAENVGMATGDTSINRSAPILCCTAEILANIALSQGSAAPFAAVIMDEFHYYADAQRGVAWQIPLLTMHHARFLLMSATMGDCEFFQEKLFQLTRVPAVIVKSSQRPVPLQFSYAETPLEETISELLSSERAPIYLVHFSQNEASQAAQDLLSLNFCSSSEKARIKEQISTTAFSSPYGKDVKKFLEHGIGLHHAGLLPKYRMLVERLAQMGLLKILCGTDTLGVGVNVPIRTVLFTRLSKYGGSKVATLSARDFHQIAGRAGRRGFDNVGYVVAQAPEHVIENARIDAKAAADPHKKRKLIKKKPPEGFVSWNIETFIKLQNAQAEPLISRFQVSHGMLLQMLNRPDDGCAAMRQLIRECHDATSAKKRHYRYAWQLFRTLYERRIIEIIPPLLRRNGKKVQLNIALQEDFSLHYDLSLYLIDALGMLPSTSPSYPLSVLSLCEAIVENPDPILKKQLQKVKNQAVAAMKADGIPYDERLELLEQLDYPKPESDFIYATFNQFRSQHPWLSENNIHPKSIAREMHEQDMGFSLYIKEYELQRFEGLLLRHLSSLQKVLQHSVPSVFKTEPVQEIEAWLTGLVRSTDASLMDEWNRLQGLSTPDPQAIVIEATPDITNHRYEFIALTRACIFRFLGLLQRGEISTAVSELGASDLSSEEIYSRMDQYFIDHACFELDPEARNRRHTHVYERQAEQWDIHQTLIDPDSLNDWAVHFTLLIAESRDHGTPALILRQIGPIADLTDRTRSP